MNGLKPLVFAALMAVAPSAVLAESYYPYSLGEKSTGLLDIDTINTIDGIRQAWTVEAYFETTKMGKVNVDYMRILIGIDCERDKVEFKTASVYVLPDSNVFTTPMPEVFADIIPGSGMADAEKVICGKKSPGEVLPNMTAGTAALLVRYYRNKGHLRR